jgi:hypothetical protein
MNVLENHRWFKYNTFISGKLHFILLVSRGGAASRHLRQVVGVVAKIRRRSRQILSGPTQDDELLAAVEHFRSWTRRHSERRRSPGVNVIKLSFCL